MFATDRYGNCPGWQLHSIEGQIGCIDILLEPLQTIEVSQNPIHRSRISHVCPETVEGNTAVGRVGERRATDNRACGYTQTVASRRENSIGCLAKARIVRDTERGFPRIGDTLLVIGIPASNASEKIKLAISTNDISLNATLGLVGADAKISICCTKSK